VTAPALHDELTVAGSGRKPDRSATLPALADIEPANPIDLPNSSNGDPGKRPQDRSICGFAVANAAKIRFLSRANG
jgi:hypothetical protein